MALEGCRFETERLTVADWRLDRPSDLPARVTEVLTAATTQFLPPDWQGDYSEARARGWIEERDGESPTLLITDRASGATVGLVILFEEPLAGDAGAVDLRIGYVLAEAVWGRGLASELVAGLVRWCREESSIASISGGVETDNVASARVLLKNGFVLVEPDDGDSDVPGEDLYRLVLR